MKKTYYLCDTEVDVRILLKDEYDDGETRCYGGSFNDVWADRIAYSWRHFGEDPNDYDAEEELEKDKLKTEEDFKEVLQDWIDGSDDSLLDYEYDNEEEFQDDLDDRQFLSIITEIEIEE